MRHLEVESGHGTKIKCVALYLNFNFCLRSNFISGLESIVSPGSKQHHDKAEIVLFDPLKHFLDICST